MSEHFASLRRRVHIVNLDPAADHFEYPVAADIRELISIDDVMSELKLGPNGGLVYAMEYLVDNMDWLEVFDRVPPVQPTCLQQLTICNLRMS